MGFSFDFECKWRSKLGQKGQKVKFKKNVANHLKHMDNRYLIEKTPLNQDINTYSIVIVNLLGLRIFHECTQNFLSPCMITMRNEKKMLEKAV